MENLFVKGQYLAKTGDTRGSGSAMRGYVVATENIEKTEGASPTSKSLSMEELHINQESTTPINEKTLVKGNFKLKQAALGSKFLSALPSSFTISLLIYTLTDHRKLKLLK
jgi:hypothetical protein